MGTVASGKDGEERDESETSGYSDLRDIASALGIEDDDATALDADPADIDDLEPIGTGYGGAAAAALISDATIETPAANSPRAEPSAMRPPPPPPPKTPTVAPVAAAPAVEADDDEPKVEAKTEAKPATPPPVPPPRRATPVPAAVSLSAPAVAPVIPPASASVAAAPIVASRAAAAPPEPERRKGGMMWMAIAGVVAVGGIYWFATREQPKPAPAKVAVAAPAVDPDAAAREAAEREAAARAAAEREAAERAAAEKAAADAAAAEAAAKAAADAAAAEAAAKAAADAAAAEAAAKVEVSVSQRKKGPKPDAAPAVEDEPKAAPSKPEPLSPQEIDEKFRAECVLNPSKPGCDEIRKRQRNSADLDGNLSDKLTQQQIREGFGKVKSKAKACGGEAGVTVRVKVSIAGDSGNVMSAEALDEHAGTSLGSCVAKALEGASFSRFTSTQQGTVYPVVF